MDISLHKKGFLEYMKVSDKMKFEFRAELLMLCRRKDHSNYLFLTGDFVL